MLRFGFSLAASSPLLGDSEDNICFDSEGFFLISKTRHVVTSTVRRSGGVLTMVLNVDMGATAGTVSVFRDGVRVAPPRELPPRLLGKPLYPTVTFKNMLLQVNFGPELFVPLPFKCRMVQDASCADAVVEEPPRSDRKREVIFPVFLPDQGAFEWLDMFLEKHPGHMEISDRMIGSWAARSGLTPVQASSKHGSRDKPGTMYGNTAMDDGSVRRVLNEVAPLQQLDFVVMEVRGNLLQSERAEMLRRFGSHSFRRVARVMIGEPSERFRERVRQLILAEKQKKIDAEWRMEKAWRKRMAAPKAKLQHGIMATDEGDESKADEAEDEPPQAELTEDEMLLCYPPAGETPDVLPQVVAESLAEFSLPDLSEGFDAVEYEWSDATASAEHLRGWVRDSRLKARLHDLQPTDWFNKTSNRWLTTLRGWRLKHAEYIMNAAKGREQDEENERKDAAAQLEDEVKRGELDIFGVGDTCDIGDGELLFTKFETEDWVTMGLRFELHHLVHGVRQSCQDPDWPGIHPDNILFYHQRFYKKQLSLANFGVERIEQLLALVQDTVVVGRRSNVLESFLPAELDFFDIFVKLTEESRRDRHRRIDLGDESARLRIIGAPKTSDSWKPAVKNASSLPPGKARPPFGGVRPIPAPKVAPRPPGICGDVKPVLVRAPGQMQPAPRFAMPTGLIRPAGAMAATKVTPLIQIPGVVKGSWKTVGP